MSNKKNYHLPRYVFIVCISRATLGGGFVRIAMTMGGGLSFSVMSYSEPDVFELQVYVFKGMCSLLTFVRVQGPAEAS